MQEIFDRMIEKAGELLENGTVDRVLGWKAGEFFYDPTPAVFRFQERAFGFRLQRFLRRKPQQIPH